MFLKPNLPITVNSTFDHHSFATYPRTFIWEGKIYSVKEVRLHQSFKSGTSLYHIFTVLSEDNSFFRLALDTDTLAWTLDEVLNKQEG